MFPESIDPPQAQATKPRKRWADMTTSSDSGGDLGEKCEIVFLGSWLVPSREKWITHGYPIYQWLRTSSMVPMVVDHLWDMWDDPPSIDFLGISLVVDPNALARLDFA